MKEKATYQWRWIHKSSTELSLNVLVMTQQWSIKQLIMHCSSSLEIETIPADAVLVVGNAVWFTVLSFHFWWDQNMRKYSWCQDILIFSGPFPAQIFFDFPLMFFSPMYFWPLTHPVISLFIHTLTKIHIVWHLCWLSHMLFWYKCYMTVHRWKIKITYFL